MAEWIITDGE